MNNATAAALTALRATSIAPELWAPVLKLAATDTWGAIGALTQVVVTLGERARRQPPAAFDIEAERVDLTAEHAAERLLEAQLDAEIAAEEAAEAGQAA